MKNSENDYLELLTDTFAPEETDCIDESAAATDVAFDEHAVTELTLAKIRKESASAPETIPVISPSRTVKQTHQRKLRKVLRVMLIASCIAVFLLAAVAVAADLIYDVRFTQLLGLEGTMKELENGYVAIGITRTAGDLTVTAVDAIGDSHTQWIEIQTNKPLPADTPDGFLYNTATGERVSLPSEFKPYIMMDHEAKYYEGSHFATTLSDIDCTDYYYEKLTNQFGSLHHCSVSPFCRDGYLWYLVRIDTVENVAVNRGFVHLVLYFDIGLSEKWPIEFDWCNNYKAKEKTIRVDKKFEGCTLLDVTLTSTGIYLSYNGYGSDKNGRLNAVKLADGTELPTLTRDLLADYSNEHPYADQYSSEWDGWTDQYTRNNQRYKQYSLLPGFSFLAPAYKTSLIPVDEIAAIIVDDVEISLK